MDTTGQALSCLWTNILKKELTPNPLRGISVVVMNNLNLRLLLNALLPCRAAVEV